MKETRLAKINDEILREGSKIIREEIKDPRIYFMTSIMRVDTTSDLSFCTVYISVLGTEKEQKDTVEGLKSSAGYFRKLIAERINLRATPTFKFVLDTSMEYSAKIDKILKEVRVVDEE